MPTPEDVRHLHALAAVLQAGQGGGELFRPQLDPAAAHLDERHLEPGQLAQLLGGERVVPDGRLPLVLAERLQPEAAGRRRRNRPVRGTGHRPGAQAQAEPGLGLLPPGRDQDPESGVSEERRVLAQEAVRGPGVQRHLLGPDRVQAGLQLRPEPARPAKLGEQAFLGMLHHPLGRDQLAGRAPDLGRRYQQAGVVGGLEQELDAPGRALAVRGHQPEAEPERVGRLRPPAPGVQPALGRRQLAVAAVHPGVGAGERLQPGLHRLPCLHQTRQGRRWQRRAGGGVRYVVEQVLQHPRGAPPPQRLGADLGPADGRHRGGQQPEALCVLRLGARPPAGHEPALLAGQARQHAAARDQFERELADLGQEAKRGADRQPGRRFRRQREQQVQGGIRRQGERRHRPGPQPDPRLATGSLQLGRRQRRADPARQPERQPRRAGFVARLAQAVQRGDELSGPAGEGVRPRRAHRRTAELPVAVLGPHAQLRCRGPDPVQRPHVSRSPLDFLQVMNLRVCRSGSAGAPGRQCRARAASLDPGPSRQPP